MRQGFTLIELMIVIAIIAIIASIAIPNLLESRVSANEAAASSSLKSGVFSSQIQFQANGYQDADADNIGEFGSMRALAGIEGTNKISSNSIHLLQGQFAVSGNWNTASAALTAPALGTSNGYKFTCVAAAYTDATTLLTTSAWFEGTTAPTTIPVADPIVTNANQGEAVFIAAAAPEKFGDSGRRAFLIGADGQVRSPATAAGTGAFYGLSATPSNGTAFSAANIGAGIHFAIKSSSGTLALTDLDNFTSNANFAQCPVFAK